MKKAIFFDLDGTLWNAIEQVKDSWNEEMVKLNKPYRFTYKDIESHMGLTPIETVSIAFPGISQDEGLALFKACFENEVKYLKNHLGTLYPNEKETILELSKKYPLYIVSNADVGYIDNYVNGYIFNDIYSGFLCAGDTGFPKFKNILFLKDKERIDDVIYIGDTLKDKTESIKAGVKFIHAAYGFGTIDNDEYFVNSFGELPQKIEELFSK